MKALVVYDSFFGNTEQIAQAIGNALGSQEDVKILRAVIAKTATKQILTSPIVCDDMKNHPFW